MNIRPHTFVIITFLVFSWKYGKANGSETTMKTWKEAVLDCYGNNSFLESNTTVLQQYMVNQTEVNISIWVGSFLALLPWIEIRGCYNIPLTCNSVERDEKNAANSQLCQIKCMKRRYFAFNRKNERCVCFDEHEAVRKVTENASLCEDCTNRQDCNTHAVVYKVFDRPIILAGNNHDCLSYQCSSSGLMPIFSTIECHAYSSSYCRDGQKAVRNVYQHFWQYRSTCEEQHFTYPLLYSDNPVELCNVSESLTPGTDVWVGVYRQRLFIRDSDKTVIQNFDQIEQYISRCDHLPKNDELVRAENCSGKHLYKCVSDTPIESQKEPYNSSTSSHSCRAEDPDTGEIDNQSLGMIIGIVISISAIALTVLVILAFMYRRKYTKEPLSFNTDCRRDSHTNEIDNYENSNYQQLDNMQEKPNPYDQLQVRRNHGNVDTELTTEQTNTSFSRDEYSNNDILEYEQLDNADKDTSTHAYDQLNVFSNTTVSKEKYSKNESTKATAVTLEYEQLDNAKRDKRVNVYDQLHVTDMIDNKQNNYNSMILTDQQEETTNQNHMTVTSEYEQLDSAKKDKSVNVYDQLDVANVQSNDPTPHNRCK